MVRNAKERIMRLAVKTRARVACYFGGKFEGVWALFLSLLIVVSAFSQPESFNHPELKWRTIETAHFLIHYHQGTIRTANKVTEIAEEVYPFITGLYHYQPKEKVQFIIRDTDDYSNGGAFFYDNKIEIWARNMDFILRGTHNWLHDVVTHEFTHIISLQKSLKFGRRVPAGWLQVFGYEKERRPDVVRGFPDVLISYPVSGIVVPAWFAEGVAQFQSPQRRFDYRDSHREMILRDRVISGKLLDLNQMGVFGKNSVGNESAYNQGYSFVQFLARSFGDSILQRIAGQASGVLRLNFNTAIKRATGVSADSLYRAWKKSLEERYQQRLAPVERHVVRGKVFMDRGIGNIYPAVSPDGHQVAYLTTGKADYLSQNYLEIKDLRSGKVRAITARISSSVSWSPDGRYLAYAKQTKLQKNGSSYNDLYVYDLRKKREVRLTDGLRGENPEWSHDGRRLAFVMTSDGLTHLGVLEMAALPEKAEALPWKVRYFDLNEHRLVAKKAGAPLKQKYFYRPVRFRGNSLKIISRQMDGRQIYHPHWSPDDQYLVFDTATGFGRDIARVSASGGPLKFLLNEPCDERDPVFEPVSGKLFYASDKSGIFNIYSLNLKTGETEAYTNVEGGAFMPTVSPNGDLYYSLYRHQGYKLYQISAAKPVPVEYLAYDRNYEAKIPRLAADIPEENYLPSKPYRRRFSGLAIMPRILLDYGTVKPGFFVTSNDVLDKIFFLGGFDINKNGEYDIVTQFEYHNWKPTLFVNFFNQTTNIEDNFEIEGYNARVNRQVDFNLLEGEVGLKGKLTRWFTQTDWSLFYTYSHYRAKSSIFSFKDPATQVTFVSPPFRYTYLRGHKVTLTLHQETLRPDVDSAINPGNGHYLFIRVQREWNRFLRDFATDRVVGAEIFDHFNFNRVEADWEGRYSLSALPKSSFTVRFQGGLIDRPVNDFFDFFAGGLVGLKGYPYFSIEGRKMMLGTVTYRFPLFRNLNRQFLNIYLNKLYLGMFFQTGNAWNTGGPDLADFKSDAGVQLRLDSFSWYFFPTRIFLEAAYPFSEPVSQGIKYDKQWKFYFGVLFDFDLRFNKRF